MDKKGQKDQKTILIYSESFKQKVVKEVEEVEEGKLSQTQIRKEYDIKGSSTLNNWIKKWKKTIYFAKKYISKLWMKLA